LKCQCVKEEVEEDDVALCASGVSVRGLGEAEVADECGVDVVQKVCPDLADV
jgi:hypothetical protein